MKELLIEGYTTEEILALPDDQLDAFVFTGDPFVFNAGSAEILGEFRVDEGKLTVELAQIDGGGEGVLLKLWTLARCYAMRRALPQVEWIVHAVHCAKPNMKLRRMLELKGFEVREVPGSGTAYYKLVSVSEADSR